MIPIPRILLILALCASLTSGFFWYESAIFQIQAAEILEMNTKTLTEIEKNRPNLDEKIQLGLDHALKLVEASNDGGKKINNEALRANVWAGAFATLSSVLFIVAFLI